jgi:hypothetical protein
MGAKRKKNYYILLELMIGLGLLTVCALPLIESPIRHIQKQMMALEDMCLHIESEKTLAQFKESLYTQKISWRDIETWTETPVLIFEELCPIPIMGTSILKRGEIKSVHIKSGENTEKWAKINLEITFIPTLKSRKKLTFIHSVTACTKGYGDTKE